MGLDSFLYLSTFCVENTAGQIAQAAGLPSALISDGSNATLLYEVAYWRKFNALHKWFVDQGGGQDNGQDISITTEQLKELFDRCLKIQRDPSCAEDLLPPQDGFFFGSTEVDDYYMEQIEYTLKRLDVLLKELDNNHRLHLIYSASW